MAMWCRSKYTIFAASVQERANADGRSPAQVVHALEQERQQQDVGVSSFMAALKDKRSKAKGTSNPKKANRKAKGQPAP